MGLRIYKASAGSGKTFSLATEYITHLVKDPRSYLNVLAVTFTNKATGEMKERILQQLWGVAKADPQSQGYYEAIVRRLESSGIHLSESMIRGRCQQALENILYNYSDFRLQTIDSFMQNLVRGLAKEIGLSGQMEVELDSEMVISESVDHMVENLTASDRALDDLVEFINEKMDEQKSWHIKEAIKKFSRNLASENYQQRAYKLQDDLKKNPDLITETKRKVAKIKTDILKVLGQKAEEFSGSLKSHGLEFTDLNGGSRCSLIGYFRALSEGDVTNIHKLLEKPQKFLEDSASWSSKTNKKRSAVIAAAEDGLMALLREIDTLVRDSINDLLTAKSFLTYLNSFRMLRKVDSQLLEENRSKGRILLSQTNKLLSDMIADSDASFILEKTGARIQHVMIDEFQDTSSLQWRILRALVEEGIAKNGEGFIVGDVKQAIYRWRNSDWNILNNFQKKSGPYEISIENLKVNRRSHRSIVEMNNLLFPLMCQRLSHEHEDLYGEPCEPLLKAYSDVCQQCCDDSTQPGEVLIRTVNKGQEERPYSDMACAIVEEISRLKAMGCESSDIAVLFRYNGDIPEVVDAIGEILSEKAVTAEGFLLDKSLAVHVLLLSLKVVHDPSDDVSCNALKYFYNKDILGLDESADYFTRNCPPLEQLGDLDNLMSLGIMELVERIIELLRLDELKGEVAYLECLMDALQTYVTKETSDLGSVITFIEEKALKLAIPEAESSGIQLTSIHKSKGLEYKHVIIPYCSWALETDRHDHMIWCHTDHEPYSDLDIIPVNYSAQPKDTYFSDDFRHEQLSLWVDNLNVLYVAMTRPRENMVILLDPLPKNRTALKTNGLLVESLEKALQDGVEGLVKEEKEEGVFYRYGSVYHDDSKSVKNTINPLSMPSEPLELDYHCRPIGFDFRASNRSLDYINSLVGPDDDSQDTDSGLQPLERGSLLHALFSSLEDTEHLRENAEAFLEDHMLEGAVRDEVLSTLKRAFENEKAREWFRPGVSHLMEREILSYLTGALERRRPDRVIEDEGVISIIDFKFGRERDEYLEQVREYMDLYKVMEPTKKIQGWLWYVDEDKIVEVN